MHGRFYSLISSYSSIISPFFLFLFYFSQRHHTIASHVEKYMVPHLIILGIHTSDSFFKGLRLIRSGSCRNKDYGGRRLHLEG